uniref:Uncharacterized protein n=1 Tax=Ixodes ricinus TaxID=34613 RepID=A0A147BE82_IXORI
MTSSSANASAMVTACSSSPSSSSSASSAAPCRSGTCDLSEVCFTCRNLVGSTSTLSDTAGVFFDSSSRVTLVFFCFGVLFFSKASRSARVCLRSKPSSNCSEGPSAVTESSCDVRSLAVFRSVPDSTSNPRFLRRLSFFFCFLRLNVSNNSSMSAAQSETFFFFRRSTLSAAGLVPGKLDLSAE